MPSIKMKTKSAASCLREKHGLHVCQKSTMISKNSLSCARFSQQVADLETCVHNAWDLPFCNKTFAQNGGENEANHHELLGAEFLQGQKQIASLTDSTMGSTPLTCPSNLDTIFSPILESIEMKNEQNIHNDEENKDLDMPCQVNDNNKNNNPSEKENCNVSDFYVSDMIVSSFPMESNIVDDGVTEVSWSPDYKCEEPSIIFDVNEEYMFLPLLEDTLDIRCQDGRTYEETITNTDDSNLYLAIHQWRSSNQQSEFNTYQDLDQAECFDPRTYIRNFPELPENYLPDLPDTASNFPPALLSKESRKSKAITLVLDLDETLVHSTLDHCDDADFSFPVFFNMKEHTVYVKKRPHLQQFLERVAEMFEIVVFTASQSIYAKQLLDILDPDGKLISRRAYRESCIFADGSYTKDLTVLGVDLAKVVIIDNSPQVFQLQVNNGIPIKSWFDDPSDCALISLFPFLETLVDVDDVRPFIAKRFVNKDLVSCSFPINSI